LPLISTFNPFGAVGTPAKRNRQGDRVPGFASFRCSMLPDQRFDTLSQIDLNRQFQAVIDEIAAGGRLSVLVVTRPSRGFIAEVLAFENPSATELWTRMPFNLDTFEVVTDTLDTKLAAVRCYESELGPLPHPRSIAALRHRAHCWGSIIHEIEAEPFVTLRRIRP
jgi:hypothetical protein